MDKGVKRVSQFIQAKHADGSLYIIPNTDTYRTMWVIWRDAPDLHEMPDESAFPIEDVREMALAIEPPLTEILEQVLLNQKLDKMEEELQRRIDNHDVMKRREDPRSRTYKEHQASEDAIRSALRLLQIARDPNTLP